MEELSQIPWISVFVTSEALLGGIFAFVLLLMKFPAARFLGKLLLAYILLLSCSYFPQLAQFKNVALIAVATSVFLYVVTFFSQKNRISYLHLLPLTIGIGLLWLDGLFLTVFSVFILGFYLIRLVGAMQKEGSQRGIRWFENPGSRISWFRNFVSLNLLVLLLVIGFPTYLLVPVLGILAILLMVIGQVFKESSFLTPIPLGTKYQKSTLTPQIKSAILDKIDKVMIEEEFYLRDDASLTNLAKALGATTHHLSQVLNESMKISFQDLIARYRIRKACQILRDVKYAQVKIENVAAMVGYNSKSAFNTTFKKKIGLTPSEYRSAKDVQTYGEERLSERIGPSNAGSSIDLNHVFNLKTPSGMILHFFKIFTRNIKRNGLFAFFNVIGLTVGFTGSILIYLYIQDELSYDKSFQDSDRIYRVAWMSENPQTRTPHPMALAMANDLPEVEQAVSLSPWYGPGLSKDLIRVQNEATNVVFEEPDFYFADSTFFDIFKLDILEGDKDALKKPFALVITEPMAKKYFGDSSAIGQELNLNGMPLAVSVVVEPMPENSHFHFNAILPYVTLKQINPTDNWMTWADFGHFNYVRLAEGADSEQLESKIPEWVATYLDWDETGIERLLSREFGFALQPITDIHLHSHLRWELEDNGNILYVYILVAILAFLILIAAINYVNLTTAKSVERAKEVGIRKTLGAISGRISLQFYLETLLFTFIAFVISLGLGVLLLNSFNELSNKSFGLTDLFDLPFLIYSLIVALLIGLLAGAYPALALSSFKPTEVLKGKLKNTSQGVRLRSSLVILQFTISAILISGSFIIYNQIQFMQEKDLGFDQEAVVSLNVPIRVELGGVDLNALRTTQDEIERLSGVRSTALVSSVPGGQFNQHPFFLKDNPEDRVDASSIMVDYDIDEVLGIEIAEGRMFDRSYAEDSLVNVIINEEMARQLPVGNPVGMKLIQDASGVEYEFKVIGVVKDFHFQSLHQDIQPLILSVQPLGAGHILVKLNGQQFGETMAEIEKIYNTNVETELPFEYNFLDDDLELLYAQEVKTLSIFSVFSMLALILASLGLLGMAIAVLNQRIKEIGMRKILGASSKQIMGMILGQFGRLVGISLIIGLPLSYWLMQTWLTEFSYRAPFDLLPFIGAILVLLVVTFVSIISAVSKITYTNPVDTLRYE